MITAKPLQGMRVVDVTEGAQGPFAVSLLADLGASVVKIERPGGELMRRGFGHPLKNGIPLAVLSIARGRMVSIELDLKLADDRVRLLEIVRAADIFVQNWRPGIAEDLGLTFTDLKRENERLIYASASGFGTRGPYAGLPSLGSITASCGGMSSINGPIGGPAERVRLALLDFISAMVTAEMILAGIAAQVDATEPVHLETSQLESALAAIAPVLAAVTAGEDRFAGRPCGPSDRWVVPSSLFPCTDDGYVAIHAETRAEWEALCSVLELRPEVGWETSAGRLADWKRVEAAVAAVTTGWDAVGLVTELRAQGVPAGPVRRSIAEAMADRRLADEHMVWRPGRPETLGWIAMAQVPWRFAECDVRALWPLPPLNSDASPDWHWWAEPRTPGPQAWWRGHRAVVNDRE
jgi:crotonobetainyl-CoA:carnitine CoA-transferase CaiB-like acyl-CoA transferase